ncbi:hypothetical protein PR202_gb24372 [Eleusine coracana subsp. coracana]|uniref:Thaumatin-like protein n=1 Tax=Eleusine coracana subsp. coracana TaxID=191504 RepID=A0AAV5FMU4_ELECO|nr:hypothetical protein QOZ80_5BG0447630 [Eleusine coracana subsp. coracana]GJN35581.1 hypothetical protein PR202_gb24372 [Eleusine coracana subsp. coracana]
MASPATTTTRILFSILLVAITAGVTGAANVLVVNNCPFLVWPVATPMELNALLKPGQTWKVPIPAGTRGARIWARTDCVFIIDKGLRCKTGNCDSNARCHLSGMSPATVAEFTVGKDAGDLDYYDVSVADGFNVPMDFSSSTGGADGTIRCRDPGCADGSRAGAAKVRQCRGNSDYQVTFCP